MSKEIKTKKISLPERGTMYDYNYAIKQKKEEGGEWI